MTKFQKVSDVTAFKLIKKALKHFMDEAHFTGFNIRIADSRNDKIELRDDKFYLHVFDKIPGTSDDPFTICEDEFLADHTAKRSILFRSALTVSLNYFIPEYCGFCVVIDEEKYMILNLDNLSFAFARTADVFDDDSTFNDLEGYNFVNELKKEDVEAALELDETPKYLN